MASGRLAGPSCPAAAEVQESRPPRTGGGAALEAATHRGVVGDRRAARKTGRRATRAGLPPPGRRLRGNLRGVRVRPDREEAQDPVADESRAAARTQETDHPCGAHGRAVREAAFRRHGDEERCHAAEFPRRSGESSGVHGRSARARSGSAAAWLRARGAHPQFRARARRWRLRRPASPGILGSRLRQSLAVEDDI